MSKKTPAIIALMCMFAIGNAQTAGSDSTGMPGDNLDLRAVLNTFKESSSVEDFEKRLNDPASKINNLDLNNDGKIDYLRVKDYGKDNAHSLAIQDPINDKETQDVAVIDIEKKDGNIAHVQIVGDEDLYGKNYIVQPDEQPSGTSQNNQATTTRSNNPQTDDVYKSQDDSNTNNSSRNNTSSQDNSQQQPTVVNNYYGSYGGYGGGGVYMNVWGWPAVQYMYSPGYSYWVSPWYWGYYPGWWSPWRPYGWYAYHGMWHGHGWYGGYKFSGYNGLKVAHNNYYGHRTTSGTFQKTVNVHNTTIVNKNTTINNQSGKSAGKATEQGGKKGNVNNSAPHAVSQGGKSSSPKGNWGGFGNGNNGGNAQAASPKGGNGGKSAGGNQGNNNPRVAQPTQSQQSHNNGGGMRPVGGGRPAGGGGGGHMGGGGGGGHMGGGGGGGHRR